MDVRKSNEMEVKSGGGKFTMHTINLQKSFAVVIILKDINETHVVLDYKFLG